jgi:hypothetical protein
MIGSNNGALRRVALSAGLLGSAFAGAGVFASQAGAAPAGTKTTVTTFTLSCNASITSGTVSVKATNVYPASVKAGSKFSFKFKSITTVSGALASTAYGLAPGGSEKGQVVNDNYTSSDATLPGDNVAKPPFNESGTISSPSSFNVYTPAKGGYVTTPKFTAGKKKGTDKVTTTGDTANLSIYNKSGKKVTGPLHVVCTNVGKPPTIATIRVT